MGRAPTSIPNRCTTCVKFKPGSLVCRPRKLQHHPHPSPLHIVTQVARAELKVLRADARESSKLLEDKRNLEKRVTELMATLEVVQDQRNELRASLKVR